MSSKRSRVRPTHKTIRGPSLRARDEQGRQVEARLGCLLLNCVRPLAWTESVAIRV